MALIIASLTLAVLMVGGLLVLRRGMSAPTALAGTPKAVRVVEAKASSYRPTRFYVATVQPWVQAQIGPQFLSAYVESVTVRPGALVQRGQILATLDCRNAHATSQAVAMQARALQSQQQAVAHEADRVQGLLGSGFVSANDVEKKTAQKDSTMAELQAARARLLGTSLEVNDCVLRAPFDGEVASRSLDPGAFVRPGTTIVSIIDRNLVRVTGDAPEVDIDAVAPEVPVDVYLISSRKHLTATISRRSPAADPTTRTLHFELDIPDPERTIPVGVTAELRINVGQPQPAIEIPLSAATIRGKKAQLFVVENGIAHARTVPVLGESGGSLLLDTTLAPGALVVSEGRASLSDGEAVATPPGKA